MKKKRRTVKPGFEILPAGEMRRKYRLYADHRPTIKLNLARVPEPLRALVPLAEKFGISDDLMRADLFAKSSEKEVQELKQMLDRYADELDEWLAGPEASERQHSPEYIAFSAMRMGADGI